MFIRADPCISLPHCIEQCRSSEAHDTRIILIHLQEAVSALEPLSRQAPDEANIFFLLGKCYLRLGRRAEATVALTTARELQPKLEGAIKVTIENNGEDEEDEDED